MDTTASAPQGRRERSVNEKRERIFRAASELFAEHGFESVTTQQISDRADVGSGTLFRYASSKSELLLMVYNEQFREALEEGESRAAAEEDAVAAILALVSVVVERARAMAENTAIYQRELLFGPRGEKYRSEGLALVERLEAAISRILMQGASADGLPMRREMARVAAASVFANVHLAIARLFTSAHPGSDPFNDLERQITQIVLGTTRSEELSYATSIDAAPNTDGEVEQ